MTSKIRIIIADDNLIDREGIQRILEREIDMEVVEVARTPPEATQLTRLYQPDVLILDLRWLPDIHVIESLIHQLTLDCPETAILGLTAFPKFIQTAKDAGLKWVIGKNIGKDDLIKAVRAVYTDKRKTGFQELIDARDSLTRIKLRVPVCVNDLRQLFLEFSEYWLCV